MPSQINPNQFDDGQPVSKSALRDTLSTIKGEVEHGGFTRIAADAPERAVDAKLSEWLSVKDFGAKGDGVTDDSDAFIRMRTYCRQQPHKHHIIHFPYGDYIYSNNRWLTAIGSVDLIGNNSSLRNTNTGSIGRYRNPFYVGSIFVNQGDASPGGFSKYEDGYRIRSATADSQTLYLINSDDLANLSPGMRVLIYGFDQQFTGYPPNMRYFEWHVVESTNQIEGSVQLQRPLAYDFDEYWRDNVYVADPNGLTAGAARILPLDRGPMQADNGFIYNGYVRLESFRFLPNPTAGITGALIVPSDTLICDSISHDGYLWPSENRLATYANSTLGYTDLDKFCDKVVIRNCSFIGNVSAATGINQLEVTDCTVRGFFNTGARQQTITNNIISLNAGNGHAFNGFYDSFPIRKLEFHNNRVTNTESMSYVINNGTAKTLTAEEVGVNGEIVIADTSNNRSNIIQSLDMGAVLFKSNLSEAQRVSRITIFANKWSIVAPWKTLPQVGDKFIFYTIQKVHSTGSEMPNGEKAEFRSLRPFQLSKGPEEPYVLLRKDRGFSFTAGSESHEIYGYLKRVSVRIVSPYAGPNLSPMLYVFAKYADGTNEEIGRLNLLVTGFAEASVRGPLANSGNSAATLDVGKVTRTLQLLFRQGGNAISGSVTEMPKLALEFEATPIG